MFKFCGNSELPLRGHDERKDSLNPGIFQGLLGFTSNLDTSLKSHLVLGAVFKGSFTLVRNELLQPIMEIDELEITDEMSKFKCLAVLCDETTDVFDKSQMVVVFRYEKSGEPVERFLGFFQPTRLTAPSLACVLLEEL